jgi:peptidoglycan/LPS O-acetylase OafA/YrhL
MQAISNTNTKLHKSNSFNYDIEALRGFAAIMVVLNHLLFHHIYFNKSYFPTGLDNVNMAAHVCVLVFFVLSGYVIGISHKEHLNNKTIFTYLKKRFVRLYPIYFITVCFTLIVATNHYNILTIISNLTFTQNIFSKPIFECSPIWSLNYEVLYYLIFIPISYFRINPVIAFLGSILIAILNFYLNGPAIISSYFFGFSFWMVGLIMARYFKSDQSINPNKLIACFLFAWPLEQLLVYQGYINRGLISILHKSFAYPTSNFDNYFKYMITVDNLIYLCYCFLIVALFANLKIKYRDFIWMALLTLPVVLIFRNLHSELRYVQLSCYVVGVILYFTNYKPIYSVSEKIIKIFIVLGGLSYALYIIHLPFFFVFNYLDVSTPSLYILKILVYLFTILSVSYLLEKKLQPIFRGLFLTNSKSNKSTLITVLDKDVIK